MIKVLDSESILDGCEEAKTGEDEVLVNFYVKLSSEIHERSNKVWHAKCVALQNLSKILFNSRDSVSKVL